MLIQASSLLNKPVKALDSEANIATIKNILVDPENSRLIAFLVQAGFIFFKEKLIACADISGFTPDFIVLNSSEAIVESKEIFKAQKILEQKIFVLGATVKTEKGTLIGNCHDVLIDSTTAMVIKFYVRPSPLSGPLAEDRIIPYDKIVKIQRDLIIVQDNIEKAPVTKKVIMREKEPAKELAGATG